jgi:hydrogenase expression/formation protein HypE
MGHGAGGRDMADLIEGMFVREFANDTLTGEEDQAILNVPAGRLAVSTDGFVVSPLFFPGSDIGALAVNGTVNDVAMGGADPFALSVSFILEEGVPLADLHRIVCSMAEAARTAGVSIVTGDTKVVERGKGDGVFISTTGFGMVRDGVAMSARNVHPGDAVLVSGTMGDHGVAIMASRAGFDFETDILSDCAALNGSDRRHPRRRPGHTGHARPDARGAGRRPERDRAGQPRGHHHPRGRPAGEPGVAGACEILGLDPLYVANEGKLVAFVPPDQAEAALAAMRAHPLGRGRRDPWGPSPMTPTVSSKWKRPSVAAAWSTGSPVNSFRGSADAHSAAAHAFNSLTQRLWLELEADGHDLEPRIRHQRRDHPLRRGAVPARPDPRAVPETRDPGGCLAQHENADRPSRPAGRQGALGAGSRGAIGARDLGRHRAGGAAEMDAGPVWAQQPFDMRAAPSRASTAAR